MQKKSNTLIKEEKKNISASHSGNIYKFDFPASKEMLPPQSLIISESKTFYYYLVGQILEKWIKKTKYKPRNRYKL